MVTEASLWIEAHLPERLLKHLDTDAAVLRVEHDGQNPIIPQTSGKCLRAFFRAGKVVDDPSGDDQIEFPFKLFCFLDRKEPQFEIGEGVLLLEKAMVVQRWLADVDRHHACMGVGKCKHCRLVGSAPCNEDIHISAIGAGQARKVDEND